MVKFLESSSSSELVEKAKTFRLSVTRPSYVKDVNRLISSLRTFSAEIDKAMGPAMGSIEVARTQRATPGAPTHQMGGPDRL